MMRRRNNNNQGGGGQKHRHGGGQRRYNNNNQGGGGNRDHQNLARQKHHATQMREKFMNHARDAQNNGDRVDVEYYLQHVEHYNRVLADIAVIEAERQAQHQQHQQPQQGAAEGENEQGGEATEMADNAAESNEEPISNSNQPRMTRGPRRQSQPPKDDHNGAKAANANHEEIPLPGGVLGAV